MSLAFVFPGQGSQSVGMLGALAKVSPVIEATFAEASEVLGYDLWRRCQEGPSESLNATECTQPAMLTAGVATYRLWRERGGPPGRGGHGCNSRARGHRYRRSLPPGVAGRGGGGGQFQCARTGRDRGR